MVLQQASEPIVVEEELEEDDVNVLCD
ncbi:hypothetical protein A2U01_0069285, partial [Trifolium medium]|nr:hypothetical protein [Trifolium medium]